MTKAQLTEHLVESTEGWSQERIAAIKYAIQIKDDDPIQAVHKKGTIIEGELAETAIAAGMAVRIVEESTE